jgi:hypothetical protein
MSSVKFVLNSLRRARDLRKFRLEFELHAFRHLQLRVKTHIQRGGAERPAACDLIRGNKAVDLFPRIKSQAAGRPAVCVFLPLGVR